MASNQVLPAALVAATLLALSGCAGLDASPASGMERGDALYAAAKYREAFDAYGAVAKAANGKDDALAIEAMSRAGKAFCMSQFAEARSELAAGNRPFALMQITTALSDPACNEFPDEVKWAREQQGSQRR